MQPDSPESRQTGADDGADFGFRRVPAAEKPSLVRAVFDSVAGRYDLMNDLMSLGVHRLWREAMMDWLAPRAGQRLIDVAGGTGDIAIRFLKRAAATGAGASAVVVDPNEEMMRIGEARAMDRGIVRDLGWVTGPAESLPVESGAFDVCTIAFGLRNATDRAKALSEMHRVLAPGGRYMCLELAPVETPILAALYDRYSFNVVPRLGAMVTGHGDAYRYLVESIRKFPDPQSLAGEMREAGFSRVSYRLLSGGIAALHSAWRI
jgi:demethylmenaquinone methyltransferase / 2-methoxy-6-polyprenyl-1,4-benzoquinol methylase